MGISHLSIIKANPDVDVAAVCDSSGYLLSIMEKYTGVQPYSDMDAMIAEQDLDAVVISTPNSLHAAMVKKALDHGLHVFCEKPFCLDPADSLALADQADQAGLVTQVGYHNRFVGAFAEVKSLIDSGAIGVVTNVLAEAYGPVVTKPKGSTWRSKSTEGGGCLYDYAAHPVNLLNWYLGLPTAARGTAMNKVFSKETEDQVFSTMYWADGTTAQISVNWSDESQRKMTTKMTIWGTKGKIYADRQECQVFLSDGAAIPQGYTKGWNAKYTTEMTEPVDFYLRGEEYSAQIASFVQRVHKQELDGTNNFRDAWATDQTLQMIVDDAASPLAVSPARTTSTNGTSRWKRLFRRSR